MAKKNKPSGGLVDPQPAIDGLAEDMLGAGGAPIVAASDVETSAAAEPPPAPPLTSILSEPDGAPVPSADVQMVAAEIAQSLHMATWYADGFLSCRQRALEAVKKLDDKLKVANGLSLDDVRWLQKTLLGLTPNP